MSLHCFDESSETDLTYWRDRALSLEMLVCDLLTKNQRMRFVLEATVPGLAASRDTMRQLDS